MAIHTLLNRRRVKNSTGGSNPPSPPEKLKADSHQHSGLIAVGMQIAKRAGEAPERPSVVADLRRHPDPAKMERNSSAQDDSVVVAVVEFQDIVHR